jgi:hypothetical protein
MEDKTMLELTAKPLNKDKNLLNIEFGLSEHTLHERKQMKSPTEIKTLSGKKNMLMLGEPEVLNLPELMKAKGAKIPGDIKLMLDDYDFYQVRVVCTFKPDKDCKFVWARLGMKLVDKKEKSEQSKLPVAYDIFPKEIFDSVTVRRNYSIGPKINYAFIEVGATAGGEQEYIKYEPEIVSYGLLQSNLYWDFSKSKAKDFILGDKELFTILKIPKGMKVEAEFIFGAEVYTFLGILPMIPLRVYREDSLTGGKFLIV